MKPKQRNDKVSEENFLKVSLFLEPHHEGRVGVAQEWRTDVIKFAPRLPILEECLLSENHKHRTPPLALFFLITLGSARRHVMHCVCAHCLRLACLPQYNASSIRAKDASLLFTRVSSKPRTVPEAHKFSTDITWKRPFSQRSQPKVSRELSSQLQCCVTRVSSSHGWGSTAVGTRMSQLKKSYCNTPTS